MSEHQPAPETIDEKLEHLNRLIVSASVNIGNGTTQHVGPLRLLSFIAHNPLELYLKVDHLVRQHELERDGALR